MSRSEIGPCNSACTKTIKFMTDRDVPANAGISIPPYSDIDGYRYINIFVRFSQNAFDEPPVDLGVIFAFDANGAMGARHYVNLEQNVPSPQSGFAQKVRYHLFYTGGGLRFNLYANICSNKRNHPLHVGGASVFG